MKQRFIELTKGSGARYFIDLSEISHMVQNPASITIHFKNGQIEDFANASYENIKNLLFALYS